MADTFFTAAAVASSFLSGIGAGVADFGVVFSGGAVGVWACVPAVAANRAPTVARVTAQDPSIERMSVLPCVLVAAVGFELDHDGGWFGLMRTQAFGRC